MRHLLAALILTSCCKPASEVVCGPVQYRVNASATTGEVYAVVLTGEPPNYAHIHITLEQFNAMNTGDRLCGVPYRVYPVTGQ